MYRLELILFICGLLICFVFILLMKKYAERPLGMLAILLLLGLCLFSYISFCKYQFKQYYEKALIAPDQIRACGIFTQWSEVTHYRRHNISTEKVFYFQSDRKGFLFSNSPRARQSFPDLKTLNINEHVCFQFSPDYTDEMDRYILTGFKKQAN